MGRTASVPDGYIYSMVSFYLRSLRFFIDSLKFYQALLRNDIAQIDNTPELRALLDESERRSCKLWKEEARVSRVIASLEKKITDEEKQQSEIDDYMIDLSHGYVRLMKAAALLYLRHLEGLRNSLLARQAASVAAMEAVDTNLAWMREGLGQGVFAQAEPWPLVIDDLPGLNDDREETPAAAVLPRTPAPAKIACSIELLDPHLRERCLDLFNTFADGDQAHRFDTVLGEATKVLEDRIRRLSGADTHYSGRHLVNFAFGSDEPILRLAEDPAEQQAGHLMLSGFFGFVRNPLHHRFVETFEKERVLQVLAMIDYLLFLTESARRQRSAGNQET